MPHASPAPGRSSNPPENPEDPLFDGLTEPQRQAVGHIDGPLLVLAGPGSGKTTVVTRRVAHLIAQGIPPWQILALTFTNKAAGEMRERIQKLLANQPGDPPNRGLTVATFHSFCARMLRRHATAAGLSSRFSIYDAADQRDAIKQSLKEAGLDSKNWTPASVGHAISSAKNQLIDATAYATHASDFYTRSIAKVYAIYEKLLKRNDALDFDDLLLVMANLLKKSEDVRRDLQKRFQYLLIDEYQDTNYAQFVIAHSLAAAHGNICVVGDPDQSIYGWRGADIRNILEFEEHYPSAKIIPLGQNFRSTAHIVETAAKLIANNRRRKHKRLHTELGKGEKPTVATCFDEHHEAAMIVDEFKRRHEDDDLPWREMAVLYRINALSRVLEDAFRSASIPYLIARGTAFYERKEVKDALAYLRLVANPNDEVSLRRIINVPARGIGSTSLDKIAIFAIDRQVGLFEALTRAGELATVGQLSSRATGAIARFVAMVEGWRDAAVGNSTTTSHLLGSQGSNPAPGRAALAELVERIIRESGLEATYRRSKVEEDIERLENLEELINAAAEFSPPIPGVLDDPVGGREAARHGGSSTSDDAGISLLDTLNAYLESVALVSDADAIDPAKGAVTLMTLHAAKGLEFSVVAMAGLEEGLLPHSRAASSEAELEEERRLAFVGITRAKRHLLITRAAMRTQRGLLERTIPSQFLRELPEESVIFSDQAGAGWERHDDDGDDGPIESKSGGESGWGRASYDTARDIRKSQRDRLRAITIEFPIGCLVRHPTFGLGRVELITPRASGASAQVAFNSVGRKTLILEYAKLQRVD
ncbi:MAG: UvrD-helicase domain-containing protein [Phycisphaerales bacterium]|nr:UvrD-helicase domain-containing protein [Phycisphaerales bacterium]